MGFSQGGWKNKASMSYGLCLPCKRTPPAMGTICKFANKIKIKNTHTHTHKNHTKKSHFYFWPVRFWNFICQQPSSFGFPSLKLKLPRFITPKKSKRMQLAIAQIHLTQKWTWNGQSSIYILLLLTSPVSPLWDTYLYPFPCAIPPLLHLPSRWFLISLFCLSADVRTKTMCWDVLKPGRKLLAHHTDIFNILPQFSHKSELHILVPCAPL